MSLFPSWSGLTRVTVLGIVMVMAGTVFAAAPARDCYINSHNCPNREADQGVPVMPVGILGNTLPPAIMVDAKCIGTEIKAINTKLKKSLEAPIRAREPVVSG